MKSIARNVYYFCFRLLLRLRFAITDLCERSDIDLPPARLRFRVSESFSPHEFVRVGQGLAALIHARLSQAGIRFDAPTRLLDFGCGCGRVTSWLSKDVNATEFHAVDVDQDAVEWCRNNIPGVAFQPTHPDPPLPYPNDYFDAIFSISVFTHLNADSQREWTGELFRILKPGGMLILTVHGQTAARVLSPREQLALDETGCLFVESQKLSGMVPDGYHTAFHTARFISALLSERFEEVSYEEIADGKQDVAQGRKPLVKYRPGGDDDSIVRRMLNNRGASANSAPEAPLSTARGALRKPPAVLFRDRPLPSFWLCHR